MENYIVPMPVPSDQSPAKKRIAVVLCNLGGPDDLAAVQPFLFNLFSDPAILPYGQPWRWLLAMLISHGRQTKARGIYAQMGGGSPIVAETQAQASALELELNRALSPSFEDQKEHKNEGQNKCQNGNGDNKKSQYRVFVMMRYWHPRAAAVLPEVAAYKPDEIVLIPLYPQFSTTTSASSIADFFAAASSIGGKEFCSVPVKVVCCHYHHPAFIQAHASLILEQLRQAATAYPGQRLRIVFSAHSLPCRVIEAGDPYQRQIEKTVALVMDQIIGNSGGEEGFRTKYGDVDHVICYQSKVGKRIRWLEPTISGELHRAHQEQRGVLVVPIAFVSEHSETLVELDIEYAELAAELGLPCYLRVAALRCHPSYIACLAQLCVGELLPPCTDVCLEADSDLDPHTHAQKKKFCEKKCGRDFRGI